MKIKTITSFPCRGVVILNIDLSKKNIDIRIQTKPDSSERYEDDINIYRTLLIKLFDLHSLDKIDLTKAIKPLIDSNKIISRRCRFQSPDGCEIDIFSSGENDSLSDNEFYKGGRE
ncbi:MAG: hypothetical protein HUU50_23230 [Candidatus Brocadiae bacterium]|nr:hypothetical protein [Candidatus Brocadiia bacterium]